MPNRRAGGCPLTGVAAVHVLTPTPDDWTDDGQDEDRVGGRVYSVAAGDGPTHTQARAEHHPQGRTDAQETISYGIPTYKLDGRYVLYFAGWKQHYSVYPSTDRLVAALRMT